MIRRVFSLRFPSLVHHCTIPHYQNKNKELNIYRLDWTSFDAAKQEKHEAWRKEHHPHCEVPWVPALPKKYQDEVNEFKFAITRSYLDEIRRNSLRGLDEWSLERGFDTCIREMCLKAGIAHIEIAFSLLNDCIFDLNKNYWSRDYSEVSLSSMLYRFWHHQTGRGLLSSRALFPELKEKAAGIQQNVLKEHPNSLQDKETVVRIEDYLKAMELHEEAIDKSYKNIYVCCDEEVADEQ